MSVCLEIYVLRLVQVRTPKQRRKQDLTELKEFINAGYAGKVGTGWKRQDEAAEVDAGRNGRESREGRCRRNGGMSRSGRCRRNGGMSRSGRCRAERQDEQGR